LTSIEVGGRVEGAQEGSDRGRVTEEEEAEEGVKSSEGNTDF
jgi:hypothetical protein